MHTPSPDDPAYSLGWRVVAKTLLAGIVTVILALMFLEYQGLIDVARFGISEDLLLVGGLAVIAVSGLLIFLVWRCPGCQAYLGKSFSPERCPRCGAGFR